jgi:hypothetical protein
MAIAGGIQARGATRGQVYAVTILALLANAVAKTVVAQVGIQGVDALANGLGLSWAFWLSLALCVRLAIIAKPVAARPADWRVAGLCIVAAASPIGPLSSAAATLLGLWLLFDRTSDARLRAAAVVLLAITVNLLWGPLLMVFFVAKIAALDAHVVALIVHTTVQANRVLMLDGHHMSIIQACTSVENASVALMMFVAIVRTFRFAPRASEWVYLAAVFAFVVVVNDVRLSLMAQNARMFDLVHGPVSWVALNLTFTAAGLIGAALCVRHEILA